MPWVGRIVLVPACMCLLQLSALAAPDYIEASPDDLTKAYGAEVAGRAFSDELTETRTATIKASLMPDEGCGDDPALVLSDVFPYRPDPNDVMWIERYRVDCEKELHRAILMLVKDGEIQAVSLVPGTTIADPQLQVDAGNFVRTAALTRSGEDCSEATVTDSEVVEEPAAPGKPWKERWTAHACGNVYEINVDFTPSEGGGTDISVVATE